MHKTPFKSFILRFQKSKKYYWTPLSFWRNYLNCLPIEKVICIASKIESDFINPSLSTGFFLYPPKTSDIDRNQWHVPGDIERDQQHETSWRGRFYFWDWFQSIRVTTIQFIFCKWLDLLKQGRTVGGSMGAVDPPPPFRKKCPFWKKIK